MEAEFEEKALVQQQTDVFKQASAIIILSKDGYEGAMNFLRDIKIVSKNITNYWAEPKQKSNEAWKAIVAKEKAMLEPLAQAEVLVKQKMGVYVEEQKRIEMEIQKKQEEARRIEATRLMEEAAKAEQNGDTFNAEVNMAMAATLETPSNFTGNTRQAGTRVTKSLVIVNEMAVPRELCVPDMAKIKAYFTMTNKVPAGVQIQETTTIVAR